VLNSTRLNPTTWDLVQVGFYVESDWELTHFNLFDLVDQFMTRSTSQDSSEIYLNFLKIIHQNNIIYVILYWRVLRRRIIIFKISQKIRRTRRRRKYIKRKTRIKLEKEKGCIERGPGSQREEQAHIRDHYTAWQDHPSVIVKG
jgi:hypothetical protein